MAGLLEMVRIAQAQAAGNEQSGKSANAWLNNRLQNPDGESRLPPGYERSMSERIPWMMMPTTKDGEGAKVDENGNPAPDDENQKKPKRRYNPDAPSS